MAIIESWFNQDMKEAVKVRYLDGNVFSADSAGNLIGVNVFDGGSPASLSGTVSGSIIRADGVTVFATGSLSGEKASVVMPSAAYAVPGPISIVIKLTTGGAVITLCAVVANVYQSSTDAIVDPGTIIPSVQALIDAINQAVASIPPDYSELVSDVTDMEYGLDYINLLKNVTLSESTSAGLKFTPNDDGTISISGTQTANASLYDYYISSSSYPGWLLKNQFFRFSMKGTESTHGAVQFLLYEYDGTNVKSIAVDKLYVGDGEYIIYLTPNVTYSGVIVRIGVYGNLAGFSARVKPMLCPLHNKGFIPDYVNKNVNCTPYVSSALSTYNYVEFDRGEFPINNPVFVPQGAKVKGAGKDTVILLGGDATYAFYLTKENEVSELCFNGDATAGDISTPGYGSGIRYYRDQQTEQTDGKIGFVHNCWFYNFHYAGIESQNTGGGVNEGLVVSDCYFQHCWCGISLIQKTEYWEVSNCVMFDCTIGVINNGGNNKFINCSFKTNGVAFYVNANDASIYNDGHGQCIGCTFNHIGNNQGIAIRTHTLNNGYDFIGCHFWYSKVRIYNSKGVRLLGCTFGQLTPQVEASGDYPVFLQSCLFYDEPTLTLTSGSVVSDCYQFDGTQVTA